MNRRKVAKVLRNCYKTRPILGPQLVCIFKTSISQNAQSIKFYAVFITARNEVCEGYVFTRVCDCKVYPYRLHA